MATHKVPTEEPSSRAMRRRQWRLVLLLLFDLGLVTFFWCWCLFGHQPEMLDFLQTVFTIVGVLIAILFVIVQVSQPVALDDILSNVWTNRGCLFTILVLTGLVIVITPLFWPLGLIGECGCALALPPTLTHTSTLTPTPGVQVAIEIDGQDAGDGFCREIIPNSSHRIQVTALDTAGAPLPPGTFSYKWRFNPPDSRNEEKIEENFRCNAIAYYASPRLNSQTITVEVLKEKKTVVVRNICFNIAGPP